MCTFLFPRIYNVYVYTTLTDPLTARTVAISDEGVFLFNVYLDIIIQSKYYENLDYLLQYIYIVL